MKKLKKYKKTTKKLSTKNSKILHDTMVTLGALKEADRLHDLPMHEIQVHLLDENGDGIVLCLEYDERTGELEKTFHSIDDAAYDEYGEEYAHSESFIAEVELEEDEEPLDPYAKVPNVKSAFDQAVSEEYDEIFQDNIDGSRNDTTRKRSLLN